jgi:hypothetical protein
MKHLALVAVAALSLASSACKKQGPAQQSNAKLADYTDRMCACTDAKCVDQVNADLRKWSESQPKNEKEGMSDEDKAKSEALAKKLVDCMNKASGMTAAPGSGAGSAAGSDQTMAAGSDAGSAGSAVAVGSAGAGSAGPVAVDVPPACQDYRATIDKLSTCQKMDQAQRDAFKNAYDAASKNWSNFTPSQKDSIGQTCKQANDAVVAAAKKQCGW